MFTEKSTKKTTSTLSRIPFTNLITPNIIGDAAMLDDLENRLSVRFFLKRSKKFHYDNFGRDLIKERESRKNRTNPKKYNVDKTILETGGESVLNIDIFRFLKELSVSADKKKMVLIKKPKSEESRNFEFSKPKIFACHKCSKLLFHKLAYRRHMIFHMSYTQHCKKCNKAFAIRSDRRKHETICRKRKTKCTTRY